MAFGTVIVAPIYWHLITFCMLGKFACFFCLIFFENIKNIIRVPNSFEPDLTWHTVGPDLAPNCLQRLSADSKSCC